MKRIVTGFMLAVIMSLGLTACANNSKNNDVATINSSGNNKEYNQETTSQNEQKSNSSVSENKTDINTITDNNMQTQQENNNTMTQQNKKIKITTAEGDIIIRLENNKAVDDLLGMLPMTMHLEDFNNTEKISYMDDKLDTSDAVTEYAPEAGSFAYYIPWGNLSLFYEDFRKSTGLAELGNVEEGIEYIKNMDKYESVTISVIE